MKPLPSRTRSREPDLFARHSAPYMVPATLLLVLLASLAFLLRGVWVLPAALYLVPFGFIVWFFRDPERAPGEAVVSPADGKVLSVSDDGQQARLVIFMAPTSVHVNRAPMEGTISRTAYRRGSHVPAFKKESERNERFDLELSTTAGPVGVALIAGTVARRIHPYIEPGNVVKKGDRIGLIAFGSRCELTLPGGRYEWQVAPGTWIRAGSTTVARERGKGVP